MRVHIKTTWQWDEGRKEYAKVSDTFYDYNGPVALACGASSEQKSVEKQQQSIMDQMMGQAKQIFGGASSVFQSLVNTFTPTIKAGPNQQGMSPAELAARQSGIVSQTAQGYKNVRAALGNAQASVGGGNAVIPSGVNEANDVNAAIAAAENQSEQLTNLQSENYAIGRENYNNATKGLAGATEVFNPATSAGNAATSSGEAVSNTANQIATQNNSWMSAVSGALGGVAGSLTGGFMNKIPGMGGGGGGGFGALPVSTGSINRANA